jgi:autophagy-related protein 5
MVSRQTYFPLVLDKVHKHFVDHVSPTSKSNEIWLEFNGTLLKWHYPVGLLYDLYVYDASIETVTLPWLIHVHFDVILLFKIGIFSILDFFLKNFPEEELLRCPNKETVEAYFMSTLKEAASLKNRGKIIHDMQDRAHKQLWKGFQTENFDQFWSINKKLMEMASDLEIVDYFKHIPFRIYQSNQNFIQKLFSPVSETGEKRTLRDLLVSVFNFDFLAGKPKIFFLLRKKPRKKAKLFLFIDKQVIIQGIRPSLNTPIQWLSEHFSYPDNFLHIVLK